MLILGICDNPDILSVVRIVNLFIMIISIAVPIILIIMMMLDYMKAIKVGDEDLLKKAQKMVVNRVITCVLIFLIPTFVSTLVKVAGGGTDYTACLNNATLENIASAYLSKAESLVAKAEETKNYFDYTNAKQAVGSLDDEEARTNLNARLDVVRKEIDSRIEDAEAEDATKPGNPTGGGDPLNPGGGTSSDGVGQCRKGQKITVEPDPADAISCWPNVVSISNFVFPKDSNGKMLGSWPKNYKSIPTQLSNYKTYSGEFIVPVTPHTNGKDNWYDHVYEHNGIDFMAYFGTPIYSPVDGTLDYSEWGHTSNMGGDETSYSVSITMNKAVNVGGKTVKTIFLTHMSGIRYRCARGTCNRTVKKGELLGFVGNAAGDTYSVGWAPHLHMSIYPSGNYDGGLRTTAIENLYNLKRGMTLQAGG